MQKYRGFILIFSLALWLVIALSGVSVAHGGGTLMIVVKYERLSNTALFVLISLEHSECNLANGFDPDNLEDFHRSWVLLKSRQKSLRQNPTSNRLNK